MHAITGFIAGVLIIASIAPGQSIRVSLSAMDRHTAAPVVLDSVSIENSSTMWRAVIREPFIIDIANPTGVNNRPLSAPDALQISSNYANPFSDVTSFEIATTMRGSVQIELYSISGRREAELNEVLEIGTHYYSLVAGSLTPGVYLLVVRVGEVLRTSHIVKGSAANGGKPALVRTSTSVGSGPVGLAKVNTPMYRFTGYAATYQPEMIESSPLKDTAIVFAMRRIQVDPIIERFVCLDPVMYVGDTAIFVIAASSDLKSLSRILIDIDDDGIMDDSVSTSGADAQVTFRHTYAAVGRFNARACATDAYGNTFCKHLDSANSVLDPLPLLTTAPVIGIRPTEAKGGGNIEAQGRPPVIARGVCWSTTPGPTTENDTTVDGAGIGNFSSSIRSLVGKTTYYVRAYATNTTGTSYGNEVSFQTADSSNYLPSLTTDSVHGIWLTSASCGGKVISDRGYPVTSRGVCWSTAPGPTIDGTKTNDGAGMGSFVSVMTGLSEGTKYFVRAYATNSMGTKYGAQKSFTTLDSSIYHPIVSTAPIMEVTGESARCGGNVSSDGGYPVTERGVCWSMSSKPTITDSRSSDGSGVGSYESIIPFAGLIENTTYYVRAYATNSIGTGYGNEVSFITGQTPGSGLVKIGTQVWMLRNLDVSTFRNGDTIPQVTDVDQWDTLSTAAWCYNNNDPILGAIYGKLYNSYAVNDQRGLAPIGWHVATDIEWKTLEIYLGMSQAEADVIGWRGTTEGGKLKEVGTTHWKYPNKGADNSSGFTALPGGCRYSSPSDRDVVGNATVWWTSTKIGYNRNLVRELRNDITAIIRYELYKTQGASVRCVKE